MDAVAGGAERDDPAMMQWLEHSARSKGGDDSSDRDRGDRDSRSRRRSKVGGGSRSCSSIATSPLFHLSFNSTPITIYI